MECGKLLIFHIGKPECPSGNLNNISIESLSVHFFFLITASFGEMTYLHVF